MALCLFYSWRFCYNLCINVNTCINLKRNIQNPCDPELPYDTISSVSDRTKLAAFWQSTERSSRKTSAYPVIFNKSSALNFGDYMDKKALDPVRCIKND